jgi:large subunit ribosomal protein L32
MGVPKRRTSKARKNKRRSAIKLTSPAVTACPRCHEPKVAHTVCQACGYYRELEVLEK